MISLQRVPLPRSIQVHNVKGITKDNLELYFENTRSGGGEVKKTKIKSGDHPYAIVEFQDRTG